MPAAFPPEPPLPPDAPPEPALPPSYVGIMSIVPPSQPPGVHTGGPPGPQAELVLAGGVTGVGTHTWPTWPPSAITAFHVETSAVSSAQVYPSRQSLLLEHVRMQNERSNRAQRCGSWQATWVPSATSRKATQMASSGQRPGSQLKIVQ